MRRPIDLPPWPDPDPVEDLLAMALVQEVCERDPRGLSAASVANRAGVSLAEFHERFDSFDACLLDVHERSIFAFEHRVGSAFNAHSVWRTGLRAAAYETAAWLEENPVLTDFGAVKVLSLENEMVRVRREELFLFCAEMIDRGREEAPDPGSVPEPAAMMAIGSILQLLTHRLQAGTPIEVRRTVPEMLHGVMRVYLGDEAAEEELTLPPPTRT